MNFLLISQSLVGGGAEKVAANLSIALSNTDKVYILTYDKDNNEFPYAGERINIDCAGGNVGLIKKIRNAIYRIAKVKQIKKAYHIDCSISLLPQTDYVNVLTKCTNEKVVVEISTNTSAATQGRLKHLFRKFVLQRADYVVAVSEGARRDIVKLYSLDANKTATIYNTCDLTAINSKVSGDAPAVNAEQFGEKYIITMGSFRKPKGHWHLIKAFSCIADQIPEYNLVILGDGEYRNQYEKLISTLGLDGRVVMPGFLTDPYQIVANASLFAFSSIYEGFGNVIIEAMACGVPVISSDCNYGPREIISPDIDVEKRAEKVEYHKYGCLIPNFGMQDIDCTKTITLEERLYAEGMLSILMNQSLQKKYIEMGLERAKDFDNSYYAKKWLALMKND